ncbi:elongation factor G [bacterium]|nr:elongation factor G [bacterium]
MAQSFDIQKIRNIGVIAHIDAGKTTTTERILHYTGEIHKMGDVDEGTTVTDFDPQEQERGITIRSAAVSCRWRDVRINLIDTPGHVDFTAEVERSLRVLDGGIVVFSGVEGVEAQSETVWHQADHYRVPRVCFINKLDRIGADFYRTMDDITQRLGARVCALQIPIGREKEFAACIDLIQQKAIFFNQETRGKETIIEEIPSDMEDEAALYRERMIETLADVDDEIANLFLEGADISEEALHAAVRRATISLKIFPTFCGSSLKYMGVQPVLDAVAQYLPSPLDIPPIHGLDSKGKDKEYPPDPDKPFVGLLFKIQSDKHEELGFVRIYSGTLKPSSRILSTRLNKKENITRLMRIQADRKMLIESASAGDIVGVIGLKDSVTGDTLCDPKEPAILEQITFPETVISTRIEPESSADKDKLASTLALLQREDPTFRARVSPETGEVLISGMGELHLEVLTEKIRKDYNVKIRTGKPRVSYRETLKNPGKALGECHRQIAAGSLFAEAEIAMEPMADEGVPFEFRNRLPADSLVPFEHVATIEDQLREECRGSGMYGFPLSQIRATLLSAVYRDGESNEQAYRLAVAHAVQQILTSAGTNILEPVMKLEVRTPEEYLGDVTSDMAARRAAIENVSMRGPLQVITAAVPLREMFGYSTSLRSLTQGRAVYTMEPLRYDVAPNDVAQQLM